MLFLGIGIIFAGYAVGSWGYVLVKGWNITLREWVSPLHPYQWPASGSPPPVPPNRVFPGGAAPGGLKEAGPPAKQGGSGAGEGGHGKVKRHA